MRLSQQHDESYKCTPILIVGSNIDASLASAMWTMGDSRTFELAMLACAVVKVALCRVSPGADGMTLHTATLILAYAMMVVPLAAHWTTPLASDPIRYDHKVHLTPVDTQVNGQRIDQGATSGDSLQDLKVWC